jgi:hypothetical protein
VSLKVAEMAQFWRLKWLKWAYLHVFAGRVEGVWLGSRVLVSAAVWLGFIIKPRGYIYFGISMEPASGSVSTGIRGRKFLAGRV